MDDESTVKEANKICSVCGDKALGYNFNAISCESCKAFFRRNALKNKTSHCPFNENCNITPVTRRFCQKCRLDKCFKIGMKKEYIMTEVAKSLKRQKIEQNRSKRHSTNSSKALKAKKKETSNISNVDYFTSTSIPSVASTSSDVSDTYFVENSKKYTQLGVNNQVIGGNVSPSSIASSPNSSSSKNYFQEETSAKSTPKYNLQSTSSSSIDRSPELDQMDFNTNSSSDFEQEKNTDILVLDGSKSDTILPDYNFENYKNQQSPGDPKCKENNNSSFYETLPTLLTSKTTNFERKIPLQLNSSSSSQLIQDKSNVKKLVNNPKIIAQIIQDKNLFKKVLTSPEVINHLATDPIFLKIIEENLGSFDFLDEQNLETNKNIQDTKSNCDNPLLKTLITSKNHNNTCDTKILPNFDIEEKNKYSDDITIDVLKEVQRISIADSPVESILCEAIKLEFSALSSLNSNNRDLNDAESAKLNELIVANKALSAPLDDEISILIDTQCKFRLDQADPKVSDLINLTSLGIRRLIKMAKKISAFKNMCQADQIALLKGGCTEMMMLRSLINYDTDKDMWKIPYSHTSKIRGDILKGFGGNLYIEYLKFVKSFDLHLRDENIILILSSIALFTPGRPNVVHHDVIKLEQNSYYYLLRRYLESVYPGCEAKLMFLKLIQNISELHRLNNEVVNVYLNVNPTVVEPLLIEIFDLKP